MVKVDQFVSEDNMSVVRYERVIYNATLNQSDLKTNANKFYII